MRQPVLGRPRIWETIADHKAIFVILLIAQVAISIGTATVASKWVQGAYADRGRREEITTARCHTYLTAAMNGKFTAADMIAVGCPQVAYEILEQGIADDRAQHATDPSSN